MNATYSKGYMAHTTNGHMVTLPDDVASDQAACDGLMIWVLTSSGDERLAVLRGDLYGLGSSGTGDPIVELQDSDYETVASAIPQG